VHKGFVDDGQAVRSDEDGLELLGGQVEAVVRLRA